MFAKGGGAALLESAFGDRLQQAMGAYAFRRRSDVSPVAMPPRLLIERHHVADSLVVLQILALVDAFGPAHFDTACVALKRVSEFGPR